MEETKVYQDQFIVIFTDGSPGVRLIIQALLRKGYILETYLLESDCGPLFRARIPDFILVDASTNSAKAIQTVERVHGALKDAADRLIVFFPTAGYVPQWARDLQPRIFTFMTALIEARAEEEAVHFFHMMRKFQNERFADRRSTDLTEDADRSCP